MSMEINDVYRASEVMRWHIVKTRQKQSIAEHSFMVAMIANVFLDDLLGETCDEMDSLRAQLLQYALVHDLDEVITGDIPSPFKQLMTVDVEDLTGDILGERMSNMFGACEMIKDIVKLADVVEAKKFLLMNKCSGHAEIVFAKLNTAVWEHYGALDDKYPDMNWEAVRVTIRQLWEGDEWTLDHYVAERKKAARLAEEATQEG